MSRDAIFEDPERFVKELKNDPMIVDRWTFKKRAKEVLHGNNALKTIVDNEEVVTKLMNTKTIRETIKENTKAVPERIPEERPVEEPIPSVPVPPKIDFMRVEWISKKGKVVVQKRRYPKRFTPIEQLTLKRQLQRNLTPQQAYQDYVNKYGRQRSFSSYKTKYYRLR